ncbi:MAG: VTT domain-containing protein [Phycisphaerales bacterium]|nr:VTT domain-containing protein [Phycisphaerales bacterium]
MKDAIRSTAKALGPAGVLAVLWLVAPALLGFVLVANLSAASNWLETLGPAAPYVFALIFAVTSGLGILPTYAQAVVAGWVFGGTVGIFAALGGFVGGAIIGWAVARLVSSHRVEDAINRNSKARVIREALVGRGFWPTLGIVTLIRIPPNSPFALTNLAFAACGVGLFTHSIGAAVGMSPRTAIIVLLSAAAAASGAKDLQTFVVDGPGTWVLIGGVVTLIVVFGIITFIAERAISKATGTSRTAPTQK